MKKYTLLLILLLVFSHLALAQMKPQLENTDTQKVPKRVVESFSTRVNPVALPRAQRPSLGSSLANRQAAVLPSLLRKSQASITKADNGQVIFIEGSIDDLEAVIDGKDSDYFQQALAYLTALQTDLQIVEAEDEFELQSVVTDELGHTHIRLQQTYQGVKVQGSELILHNVDGKIQSVSGRIFPTPELEDLNASLGEAQAIELAKNNIRKQTYIKELSARERALISYAPVEADLVIFHKDKKLDAERLVWQIRLIPHLAQHWLLFLDANTGEIIQSFDQVCHLHNHLEAGHTCSGHDEEIVKASLENKALLNGPRTANAVDLNGITRTINTYESDGAFFMIDASRPMFSNFQSDVVGSPDGAVWTLDGQNGAPQRDDFEVIHNANTNNQWSNRIAVSAHYNAGVAYEYFRQTFNRNSIDGNGGTIISIINIADEDGRDMDNAFWSGQAMFYGNGAQAFSSPLAKSLDVAGHEMSHGVIQNTAGLEYYGESGALNESFADIFGVMMDRDDWGLGEDVVNTNFYRTGVLRSMSNPNNGGNSLSDLGWQPANTNEQYLGREDNAGVHINSGIPNRAFYLFATAVGKAKAEQVFYRALNTYLIRSSQFIDARLAVIRAAQDLHGENSAEVRAAEDAFNTVGIGSGGGGTGGGTGGGNTGGTDLTTLCEIESNPGQEFVILTDASNSQLYLANSEGDIIQNPYLNIGIKSKPSFTDDGGFGVFVAADGTIRFINTQTGEFDFLEANPQTIWRNIVISKDGERLAITTDDQTPEILVFDFNRQEIRTLELSNSTTAPGVSTNSVLFADAMEWDYDGEFLIYDSFNRIPSGFGGDIEYWDISFLRAWDKQTNDFGEGLVLPLFANLPENVSVGNPTFAKNSSCVIAFDFVDGSEGTAQYEVLAANYETGDIGTLFEGNTPGYPNYTKDDDAVIFDFLNQGAQILAIQDVAADKITPEGEAFVFVDGGSWGTVIATGERTITNTAQVGTHQFRVYPTAFEDAINIEWNGNGLAQIELYDLLGRRVLIQQIRDNAILATSNLQAGTYFMNISVGAERSTQKLIKVANGQ